MYGVCRSASTLRETGKTAEPPRWPALIPGETMSERNDDLAAEEDLAGDLRGLFPELCGESPDLESHAGAIVVRGLNDGSPRLQEELIRHYGLERVKRIARSRADRLTNPAYRRWRERLDLPPRDPSVAFVQGLWRK